MGNNLVSKKAGRKVGIRRQKPSVPSKTMYRWIGKYRQNKEHPKADGAELQRLKCKNKEINPKKSRPSLQNTKDKIQVYV
jgi:hypothetical protein